MLIITDAAKEYLQSVLKSNDGNMIRIYAAGISWGQPKLGLALAEPNKTDAVNTINGIQIAIAENVVSFTESLVLDYQKTRTGTGLVWLGNTGCC